jgi:hypothetical protein
MVRVWKEIEVEVDLDDFDTEDLIDELRSRGEYEDEMLDDIFALYKEWMDDQGDRDTRFEKAMRKFFEKHLNKVSA